MGSLALAAAGAVGGFGQGVTEVGQQAQKAQLAQKESDIAQAREETLLRLRDQYEKSNIQQQQQFQLKGAQAGREFQVSQQHEKLGAEETKAKEHETAATGRANILANARRDVAKTNANARVSTAKQVPEFTSKTLTRASGYEKKPDGTVDYTRPTQGGSFQLLTHKSGQGFVAVGDMYLPYDAAQTQFPDPKSVARAPAAAVSALSDHPEKMMDFAQKYGYVPRNAVSALQQQKDQKNDPSLPKFLPQGVTAGPETPVGGAAEDNEDTNAAEGEADPYGTSGLHPTTSPEDNEPAK